MMRIVNLIGRRECTVVDAPMPRVRGDYVLVRVIVAPMCNEHHAYANFDFRDRNRADSLGHEAAGEVVEAAPHTGFRPGDRVVVLSGYPCGRCSLCLTGMYAHCEHTEDPRKVCDSPSGECAFAQYMIKPARLLVPIPDGMSYEHASMACCGLGATYTAMVRMNVVAGETVVVTGLGPVGLGGIINGVAAGARMIAVGRNRYRAALATELGAVEVIDPEGRYARQRILELTDGRGADAAIECSAGPMYQHFALDGLRRGGRMTFLAESGELSVHVDRSIIQKGVTLMGSLDLYLDHVPGMMARIASAPALIDRFITHRLPMTRIKDAWELQLDGACGKIVLDPWR